MNIKTIEIILRLDTKKHKCIVRGGQWGSISWNMLSAGFGKHIRKYRGDTGGFRLVQEL